MPEAPRHPESKSAAVAPAASTQPAASELSLKLTALHALHLAHGARMVPFAGYDMPVQYAAGVLKEHLHTRSAAGLFDVSHMGQITLRARSGNVEDAARALERLVPMDIAGLSPGRQRYAFFTDENGGILDDLMVAHRGDHLLLVVNAACKAADEAHLRAALSEDCEIERLDRALIALQGPKAEAALARLAPECADMRFMDVRELNLSGQTCIASRSGYTGEDGYEISIANDRVYDLVLPLLQDDSVALIGLGARDSLRLEAGMCLYGADLDTATTPIEANLAWAIQPSRRNAGKRSGGFPGADVILNQLASGTARARVGLLPDGRAPVRAGSAIYRAEDGADLIGIVTSGGFGPSLNRPVAMGYVATSVADAGNGTTVYADVRGKRLPMSIAVLPFITPRYKR
ncbi:MAG: glycine cleavage system aminomethyltransferase GcvT [Hyphomicrobium sp.]